MQQDNRPVGWLFGHVDTGVIRNMKVYKVGVLHIWMNGKVSSSDDSLVASRLELPDDRIEQSAHLQQHHFGQI